METGLFERGELKDSASFVSARTFCAPRNHLVSHAYLREILRRLIVNPSILKSSLNLGTVFLWQENTPRRILKVRSSNTFIHSAENDRYYKCAGDAVKKCFIESFQVFEHDELEEGDPEAADLSDEAYIRCVEEQKKTCNHPIMRHLFEQTEAFKKDLKQLEMLESEEQQG